MLNKGNKGCASEIMSHGGFVVLVRLWEKAPPGHEIEYAIAKARNASRLAEIGFGGAEPELRER